MVQDTFRPYFTSTKKIVAQTVALVCTTNVSMFCILHGVPTYNEIDSDFFSFYDKSIEKSILGDECFFLFPISHTHRLQS